MVKRPSNGQYPEFGPLFDGHTDGLQFVHQVRLSLKRGVSQGRLKDYCIWFWQHHIKPHFYQEEKLLMPFLDQQDEYVQAVWDDHEQIRELIASFTGMVRDLHFLHLANLIEGNIRFEEDRFFPDIYHDMKPEIRSEVHRKLLQYPVDPGIWEDEFWYE
jgi:hypothetical protein